MLHIWCVYEFTPFGWATQSLCAPLILNELSGLHNCHSCSFAYSLLVGPGCRSTLYEYVCAVATDDPKRHASNRQSIAANACYSCHAQIGMASEREEEKERFVTQ